MDTFLVGLPKVAMLSQATRPAFLSRRALLLPDGRQRATLPRSAVDWWLDSGGFTELSDKKNHARCYRVRPAEYAAEVCRYAAEIGRLQGAFIMDWMCESVVTKRTGRSVEEHQLLTIESALELRTLAPGLPWKYVVQGDTVEDYERHIALYLANGIDLRCEDIVGVGSICRRQATLEGVAIVRRLAQYDLRLHLFGYKSLGLPDALPYIVSADSMAWSKHAARNYILRPGCEHRHIKDSYDDDGKLRWKKGSLGDCRNCLLYAEDWARDLVEAARRDAAPDRMARLLDLPTPTPAQRRVWRRDPADVDEAWRLGALRAGARDVPDEAMQAAARAAGVLLPAQPTCHFLGAPGETCAPARYQPPGSCPPPPKAPPRPRHLATLPAAPPTAPRPFAPWAPAGHAPAGTVPVRLTATRARRRGLAAGAELLSEAEAGAEPEDHAALWTNADADAFYEHYEAQLDRRLPRTPSHGAFLADLAHAPDSSREALTRAYGGGVRDALYRAAVALMPDRAHFLDRPETPHRRPIPPGPVSLADVVFYEVQAEQIALSLLAGRRETGEARRRWLRAALEESDAFQRLAAREPHGVPAHQDAFQTAIVRGVERACARKPFPTLPPESLDAEEAEHFARGVEEGAERWLLVEAPPPARKDALVWLTQQLDDNPDTAWLGERLAEEPAPRRKVLARIRGQVLRAVLSAHAQAPGDDAEVA